MNCSCLRFFFSFLLATILPITTAFPDVQKPGTDVSVRLKPKGAGDLRSGYFSDFPDPLDQIEGRVIDLSPLVVSPVVTNNDLMVENLARDPTMFLTAAGWREEMSYRSELDRYLNLFTLPFFGIAPEAIAYMYAQDAKLESRLHTLELITKTRETYQPKVRDAYIQDRYDLMRMKRHALFGSTWALPDIGK
jgi:hypothetical protein